jgi:N-methylhydantoinase A/oxoprolinase/acetone carboxylase beta subunit
MERAIRTVSIERGYDPRDFALVAFGGSGGLHACELAAQLRIGTVIVPRYAEGLSALGMLLADRMRDYAAGVLGRGDLERRFRQLEVRARRENPGAILERTADLRYTGQSYELNVPWNGYQKAFHSAHRKTYGYARPGHAMEIVTIRVRARHKTAKPRFQRVMPSERPAGTRSVYVEGRARKIPVLAREQIGARPARGPALILDYGSTTLVPPGWSYRLDRTGNLIASTSASS